MSDSLDLSFSKFHSTTITDNFKSSRRYQSIKHDRKNKEALNSEMGMRNTLNQSFKKNREVNLPAITDRKRKTKRGTFLESWLDETLGATDLANESQSERDGGLMKNLKKFELDKQYLKSQNIPGERIQRLYQSLFIYTHGINIVFKELLQFVHEFENADLLGNFWKAFNKLLEGCTSYETVYLKVEKQHLKTISNLNERLQQQYHALLEEKKVSQEKIEKLVKQAEEKSIKYEKMLKEYSVMESTLALTDQLFNDQVFLRLKFQEKINAVYTTYEELKVKYQHSVQTLEIRNDQISQQSHKMSSLKNELIQEKIKVAELQAIIDEKKEIVTQRETELDLKSAELQELREKVQAKINKEDEAEDLMEIQISKQKALKAELTEAKNSIAGRDMSIKEQKGQINKLQQKIEELNKNNNELYEKFIEVGRKVVENQSTISLANAKIEKLERLHCEKVSLNCDLMQKIDVLTQQKNDLIIQLGDNKVGLSKLEDTTTKNTDLLEQMKDAKDRYERLNLLFKNDLMELERQKQNQLKQILQKAETIAQLNAINASKSKSIEELEKKSVQNKKVLQAKIEAMKENAKKKQQLYNNVEALKNKIENELKECKSSLLQRDEKISALNTEQTKLEICIMGKNKTIKDLESTIVKNEQKYEKINVTLDEELRIKNEIDGKYKSTSYVLKAKSAEENLKVATLNNILNDYKQKIIDRAQFVHPMIYEEQRLLALRAVENEQIWKKQHSLMKSQEDELKSRVECLVKECDQYGREQKRILDEIEKLKDENKKILEQKKKSELKFEEEKRISSIKLKDLSDQCEKNLRKMAACELLIQEKQENIHKLIETKEKLEQQKVESSKYRRPTTKQAIKKQQISQETQTDNLQERTIKETIEQDQVPKEDQEVQTENIGEDEEKDEEKEQGQKEKEKVHRQERKIGGKEYKKAMKLTYMRR